MFSDQGITKGFTKLKFRLAKDCDAGELAHVQLACTAGQSSDPDTNSDRIYMAAYYRCLIRSKDSIVLCAEDATGRIVGLFSATMSYANHVARLRRCRVRLFVAAVPHFIRHPGMIRERWVRYRRPSGAIDSIPQHDGHILFWGWLSSCLIPGGAVLLLKNGISLMWLLGANEVEGEIDVELKHVIEMNRRLGADIGEEFLSAQGVRRVKLTFKKPR